ncbi:MAG: TRAP transporter large permease subunit [Myxococcota bacterium]|nr:TRAP transporter large permease subunit [Myxococcota bacterium]
MSDSSQRSPRVLAGTRPIDTELLEMVERMEERSKPAPKKAPVGLAVAIVVLLIANLFLVSEGRGTGAILAAWLELAILIVGALAFSEKPAGAAIIGLLSLWMFLGLEPGTFIVLGGALLGILLGLPLFAIIGAVTVSCLFYLGVGDKAYTSLDDFTELIRKVSELTNKEVLLAIPFFVIAGALMTGGAIAERLINLSRALVGWMPGGLAIVTVAACIFFAAISGSSPVTVIAIGSMMYPALLRAGFREPFSLGLVTSAGSLGILIPPSIPMIVYAIVVTGAAQVLPRDLFLAGVGPGLLIGGLLSAYGIKEGLRRGNLSGPVKRGMIAVGLAIVLSLGLGALAVMGRVGASALLLGIPALFVVATAFCPLDWKELRHAVIDGFWSLMLPVVILGGIYSGLFNATEAAAVAVVYAALVERFVHRALTWRQMVPHLLDSMVMLGSLLVIVAMALGFNGFMVDAEVPEKALSWLSSLNLERVGFLLILNLFLLVVGALMDIMSAILIVAPVVAPMAMELGIDPIHLGIIFIVNLEIGYLTPPMGLNLFVSSSLFKRSIGEVIRATFPFTRVMLVGLLIVTYVPAVSVGPVNWLKGIQEEALTTAEEASDDEEGGAPATGVLRLDELMAAEYGDELDDEDDEADEAEEASSEGVEGSTSTSEGLDARVNELEERVHKLESQQLAPEGIDEAVE